MDKKKCTAIVLSAGQGKRMGTTIQKQYIELSGKPIIYYTLDAFQKSEIIDDIVLVVGEGQEEWVRDAIVRKYHIEKVRTVISGGKERYDSVWAGLQWLRIQKEQPDYVFIHDGARMFVDESILKRGYENVEIFGACVAGMPSKDTIKLIDENQFAVNTPPRKLVWAVQTPQIFKTDLIENAYTKLMKNVPDNITDDAMVVEQMMKVPVKLYEGSYENIKITTPEDLKIAEVFLEKRMENHSKKSFGENN